MVYIYLDEDGLDGGNVLFDELLGDDLQVPERIYCVLDVGDIRVLKDTNDMEDPVNLVNVRQEGVAQTLALGRTTHN